MTASCMWKARLPVLGESAALFSKAPATGTNLVLAVTLQILQQAGIQHVFYESPGTEHEWQTWRRDLSLFAPLLFLANAH
jgi:S-formylglutathione hydrolase FrmB